MKNIALIGYGNIARKHIEVFRALGCEIVASCNRSEDRNEQAKREENIPNTFTDVHTMIQTVKPDAVICCVSFWNMYQVLKDIVPYGLPILAEKPTATSWKEHEELCALAAKHNTNIMVGLNRRHYSVLEKAIEDAGGKEAITSVLVEWSEDPHHLIHNRKLTVAQIDRYIFGNTIHGLDLLTWLTGSIKQTSMSVNKLGDPYRWLMNVNGKAENGTLFTFTASWDNPVPWRVVFTARGKRYVFAPLEKCVKQVQGSKELIEIIPGDQDLKFKAGFYNQALRFKENDFSDHTISSVDGSMSLADSLTQMLTQNV